MGETTLTGYATMAVRPEQSPMVGTGDQTRLQGIVNDHFHEIWRFLRRLGLRPEDADDAAQDVMMVATQKLGVIELGRERSYLFSTAYRVARRVREARARRQDTDEDFLLQRPDPSPGPEVLSDLRRSRELLDDVLEGLPLEVRAVFVLAEIEEATGAQIAELLDLPPGTVASRLRKAREMFDAQLVRLQARWKHQGGVA